MKIRYSILWVITILFVVFLPSVFAKSKTKEKTMSNTQNIAIATFAGGCFWCTESDFEKLPGVLKVVSGYTGGTEVNPSYAEVSAGKTGHTEAVQIYFDPSRISYTQLLDRFWRHIDPTDAGGQFVDRGSQYRSAIFYHDTEQKRSAESSKARLEASNRFDKPIATQIAAFSVFYAAEAYHQDYYNKNPLRYKFYRLGSGRDQFLNKTWSRDTKVFQTRRCNTETKAKPSPIRGNPERRHRTGVSK